MRAKLIRDKMNVSHGQDYGGSVYCTGRSAEKQVALLLKLHEEAEEISRGATNPEEYADLLEVLVELAAINGVEWTAVMRAVSEKHDRLGGFKLGRIWVS